MTTLHERNVPTLRLDDISTILRRVFGFDEFRPGQSEVVASVLAGEDVLAVMPTGSGKSLCYQLPAVALGGLTVVVSPLIALMNDQVGQMRAQGVAALCLHSNQTSGENARVFHALESGDISLLYLAPERLMNERAMAALRRVGVTRLVVDEAHCVSQWGHDFRPEYLLLRQAADALDSPQLLAFTATADRATRADIAARLFAATPHVFVHGFDRPNIHLAMAPKENARKQIVDFVTRRKGRSGIVYCTTRRQTEEFAEYLTQAGVNALPYHAGMDHEDRLRNQHRFQREDDLVMTATVAFGMGVDKPDVRFVCHAGMPKSVESYYQEIGRAGRDGLPADTLTLYGLDDLRLRRLQIEQSEADTERKIVETQRLNALMALCETPRCRRQTLLAYFEESSPPCGNCDLCQSGCQVEDGVIVAQKAMSAMVRTGQRFGGEHLVNLLLGKRTEAITRWGHEKLPTFGVGADLSAKRWRAIFRQILAAGLIEQDIASHGRLVVTEAGWRVLRGQERVSIRKDAEASPARRSRRRAGDKTPDAGRDSPLLTALKNLRRELAAKLGIASYMVFPDKTLLDMERKRPATLDQMSGVFGVGYLKLAKFGQTFLDAIAKESAKEPKSLGEEKNAQHTETELHVSERVFRDMERCLLEADTWDDYRFLLETRDLCYKQSPRGMVVCRLSTGKALGKASRVGPSCVSVVRKLGGPFPEVDPYEGEDGAPDV
ncbi:DNA helicase RecQ [Fundidesulfovibrio butyratiphilus]